MNGLAFSLTGDQVSLWVLNVLLFVTWVTALALAAASFLRRSAAARHWLLCAALMLVIVSPAVALLRPNSGKSAMTVSLVAPPPAQVLDSSALESVTEFDLPLKRPDFETTLRSEDVVEHAGQRGISNRPFDPVHDRRSAPPQDFGLPRRSNAEASRALSPALPESASGIAQVLRTAVPPLLLVWLIGSCFLLAKIGRGCCRLRTILRAARPNTDVAIGEALAWAGRTLRLRRMPELVLSDRVTGPVSAGVLRSRVILPERFAGEITPQQLHDVLVHELAHVSRRDPLIVLLQNLAGALFWVHPLVKALNHRLAQAREEVCDNHVLGATDSPSYSRTLLKLATLVQPGSQLPGAVGLFNSRWKLERRVAGLLDERRNRETRLTWRGWALMSGLLTMLAGVAAFGTVSVAVEQPSVAAGKEKGAEPWPAQPDDGLLTLNLTVRMPDGSPVAGTSVKSLTQWLDQVQTARTDTAGRVTIRSIFGNGARIHASSPDGSHQATLKVTASDVRTAFAAPIELSLAATIDHQVQVTVSGKPVADAQVVAQGHYFKVTGTTGQDGVARLKLPADDRLNEVAAWHADLGVGGVWQLGDKPQKAATDLSLQTPAPLTIRLVDAAGKAVPDLDLCVSNVIIDERKEFNREFKQREAIMTDEFAAARVRTNEQGEASIPWAPREAVSHVNVDLLTANWKIDEIDQLTPSKRIVTVHVRRLKTVQGRLIMPQGANPQGLLITGDGFGPGGYGDAPQIRARRDGTFVMHVASNHGYLLGLFDREWISEPWTGTILKSDDGDPAKIVIAVQRATPVTVRVAQGANHEPVAGAWVDFSQRKEFQWIDANGKKHNAGGHIGGWLKTDADGVVRGGAGKGRVGVRLSSGGWNEEKTIQVTDDSPVTVEFYRARQGARRVIARMKREGTVYQPSPKLAVLAWTDRLPQVAQVHRPIARDDHAIEVNFDQNNLSLLAIDREQGLSGFVKVGLDKDAAELAMQPNATYGGTVRDEHGQPLADRTLQLITDGAFLDVVEPQRTDSAGKFRFTGVAVGAPLRVSIKHEEEQPDYSVFSRVLFEPGEVREEDQLQAYRQGGTAKTAAATPRPISERLQTTCENVRVCGMHALVVLQGDDSQNMIRLTNRMLGESDDEDGADLSDDDDLPVYNYLPIKVAAVQVESEAAFLKERKWPRPRGGEISLIVLDDRQKTLAMETIAVADVESANRRAAEFLARHKPVFEDARMKLTRGREQAQRDKRRVWVIIGGPRCSPCFQFARWMDRHHEVLEKDYVIVKLMEGLQAHADEINNEIGGATHGIPWFVITEPDGKILVTSEGPLGNMGMPTAIEDFRHFRKMLEGTSRRLSAEEIDKLIQSLSPHQ